MPHLKKASVELHQKYYCKAGNINGTEQMAAYRPFGAPFLKVFLGAVFTYQVIYYAWMKLETSEKKLLKNGEFYLLMAWEIQADVIFCSMRNRRNKRVGEGG